ncbi:helix-turn-helix transcriptional regulator [Mesobacillus subterraneus]|uniref:helix-turn-helix domain-containing protein n=1 Tax=Mesobacillus subterraneus TaxID=285983 RepID=UPI001CFC5043|nr:helix-turn-helix transcriptional regulator [Mesobacillus subterraneus]WLR54318.1 helix-turn-helix transcriptional regulator [Mesobacillus subterraneus]
MGFPERLRKLRKDNRLTQEELGSKINVTKVSISGYENGNRTPDTDTLQKIADLFDVSTDYLLGRSDTTNVSVAGEIIELTPEELKVFEEMKKYSIAFHDLQSDPGPKVKQLIKMWEAMKVQFEEIDKDEK